MNAIEIFRVGKYVIEIGVVGRGQFAELNFEDKWKDVPGPCLGSIEHPEIGTFHMPKQTTLQELTEEYARHGKTAQDAYKAMQKDLMRDAAAHEYELVADVSMNGVKLLTQENIICYDHSYFDDGDECDAGLDMIATYYEESKLVEMADKERARILEALA